ncbi:hypothetical protein GCM10010171_56040 [Actinokineospora fastidiosa]|uniref:Uncharacterized protein n=1 Tax=Actinokineospora fastidiosa TaxID=1816 RepID=A0A918GRS1_9PSEU|nr:hypothetical protein GCM10010171_56040 [Actinokineospora fastidiosa]
MASAGQDVTSVSHTIRAQALQWRERGVLVRTPEAFQMMREHGGGVIVKAGSQAGRIPALRRRG